jgi:hypothetical protein
MSEDRGEYNLFNMQILPRKLEKQLGITRYSDMETEEKAI